MRKLLTLLLSVVALLVNAQYFQSGQDPASIKWRQVNTQNFQLIYPDYFESQAQLLAQKLEKVYDYGSYSLGYKPRKISIILHTQTVKSNGFVAYAPKRSEFYTTPHQSIYPQDWLEQLAIHEFRHVVQIDKLNDELPKIVKLLLGEQGTALVFGAYLPWWFIEGDAVVSETALGNYGRGRFPSFLIEHRAQVVEKGVYSYDKAYLGSYKSYVPNHYRLGYYLVANTRERYGSAIWDSVLTRVGKKPFSISPFNKALKLETGMNKVQLYNSVFDSLATEWKRQDENFNAAPTVQISRDKNTYTNYQYNHWLNDSEIISYRTAMNKIPAFVKLNKNGNEENLFYPGTIFNESVGYRKDWIVWSEQISDIRWTHSGRSKIRLFNINTKSKQNFNTEFKAFAPSISPDLEKVIVVEADFSSNYYLSVYQINSGELLHRLQTPDNNYFFSPQWINEKEVVAIVLTPQGKRLAQFDLSTGKHKILFNRDLGEIKHLSIKNNELFFISGYSGKNSLYSFNFKNQEIKLLYEPRFGVEYPAQNGKGSFVLSDYTGNGFRLIQLDDISEKPIGKVKEEEYPLAMKLAQQELGAIDFTTTDTVKYESKRYNKPGHLLNFHSWAPVFVDVDSYEMEPGLSLMSQNKLGTAVTTLGYQWDTSEKTGKFYADYTYKGWFPVFDAEISTGKRASKYWLITENTSNGQVVSRDTAIMRYTWKDTQLNTSISLPLNFSRGAFYRLLQPQIGYELISYKKDSSTPDGFPDDNYQSVTYRLYYHQLLRQSEQDVYPNFGVVFDTYHKYSPGGNESLGTLSAGLGILYLPGVLPNHGIKIYAGAQKKEKGETYSFSDVIQIPRGCETIENYNYQSYSIDYRLPLLNPDFSVGALTYIRRINASLFVDYANLNGYIYTNGAVTGTFNTQFSSCGMELTGELNFLRFYAPVEIGFRSSYLPDAGNFVFDFLLSIDFTSL
jgi:hypothetical protein